MLNDHWQLCDLRLTTGRIELRLPDEADLAQLAAVAADGICQPGTRPFFVGWPYLPPAERARSFLQGHWRDRASWSPDAWTLGLAVVADGRPVGMQELSATNFAVCREVSSFSWLGISFHGQRIGTQMRAAILHLAFAGLGAAEATSGAFEDNEPSLAVSARLGYQPDGIERDPRDGQVAVTRRLRLSREQWSRASQSEVAITGLERCLPMFGLPTPDVLGADGAPPGTPN